MEEWSLDEEKTTEDEEDSWDLGSKTKPSYGVSIIILALMIVASAGGLLIENVYPDDPVLEAGWIGNALISLVIGAPLLGGSMVLSVRGFKGARLVWMGMLYFALTNYALHLFGAEFNLFFPLYVGIVVLSILALLFSYKSTDEKEISRLIRHNVPIKWVGVFIAGVSMILIAFHSVIYLEFVFNEEIPNIVLGKVYMTRMISAINLLFIVPLGIASAFWIWDRNPWGHILSIVWNVNLVVYTAALSSATLTAFETGNLNSLNELGLWISLAIGSLIVVVILLDRMETGKI
ncbi:MAG: hypothetical protein V5A76_05635 [Candidatus Thermoplasmatota archaeon]